MSERDYVLGATTNCMARDYAGKIAAAEAALSDLKNQSGG